MHANHKRQSLSRSFVTLMTLTSVFSGGGCARLYHMMHYNGVSEALHEHHRSYYHSPATGRIIAKEHHPSVCPVELPCYGYEPTCWRRWPEECVGCPPDDEVIHQGTIVEQPAAPIVPPHASIKQPTPAQQQPAPVIMNESSAEIAEPTDDFEAPADIESRLPADEVPAGDVPAGDEGADVPLPDDSALPGASNEPVGRTTPGPVAAHQIQRLDQAVPLSDMSVAVAAASKTLEHQSEESAESVEEVFESAIQATAGRSQPLPIEVTDIEEPVAPESVTVSKQEEIVEAEPAPSPDVAEEATDSISSLVLPNSQVPLEMSDTADVPAAEAIADAVDATFVEKPVSPATDVTTEVAAVAAQLPPAAEDKSVSEKDEDPNAAMVDAVDSESEVREVPRFKIAAVLPPSSQSNASTESKASSVRLQMNGPATIRFVNKRAEENVKPVAKKPATSGIRFR